MSLLIYLFYCGDCRKFVVCLHNWNYEYHNNMRKWRGQIAHNDYFTNASNLDY